VASDKLRRGAMGYAVDPKRVQVWIYPQNTTDPPLWFSEGGVASVTRPAAGKFLITLRDSYYKVHEAHCTWQHEADNVDVYAQLGEFNNVTLPSGTVAGTLGQATTVVVKTKTGTANTDVAAGAQRAICVTLVFEDTAR
jgi:hypothetical protein